MKAVQSGSSVLKAEWSCAGDEFLAIIVNSEREIVAEHWGSELEVTGWIQANYGTIPTQYVPMARAHTA